MLSSHPVDDISSTANPPSCRIQTNLLPRVMTCALTSDVSAHPWEQPVRSDHLHTEMTNSVIGCGEY
jgi:hypothetical protein